jgi:hypothetical protein
MAMRHASTGLRLLLFVGVCLTLIAGFPPGATRAATERNQDIDNTLAEFDDGAFQLTSSANFPTSGPTAGDQVGAVQLAPIAAIRGMDPGADLDPARLDAGVVALGRNIFVIGGRISGNSVDTVISNQVNLTNGVMAATWENEPSLPAVRHSDRGGFQSDVGPRTLMATAAYATGQDTGFVYVLGGDVNTGGQAISSYSVLRGTVASGRITAWDSTLPTIPVASVEGLESASAFIATLPNGRVFLYLIGGLQRFKEPGVPISQIGSKFIFYAEINTSDGSFVGNTWNATTYTIPLNPDPGIDGGLWSSPVVGGTLTDTSGQPFISFYLLGGRTNPAPAAPTSAVYRIDVNTSDGTLDLSQRSGVGSANASLGTARTGHTAVMYNGSVYVAGGVRQGETAGNRNVLGSYIQPDRRFPDFDPAAGVTYFLQETNGLPADRSGHGMVVIPNSFTAPTKAFVYVIGGSDGTAAQTGTFFTTIGDPEATQVSYPLEGYYISEVAPFTVANARLVKVFWASSTPAGAGVEISFRTSNDANCADLQNRNESQAPWQVTTPSFNAGAQQFEHSVAGVAANCFQYRARLTPNNSTSDNTTPYLLRLGIVIEIPGATDLTVNAAGLARGPDQKITGFNIVLRNENVFLPGEPTLPADFGPNGAGSAPGSFFVDVFIYPPGVTPPATQPIPTDITAYATLSIDIFRSEIDAGPGGTGFNFTIPADRPLCDYTARFNPPNTCIPRTLGSIFTIAGTYQMVVVVDGDNSVLENPTDAGKAESNNVSATAQLVITQDDIDSGFGGASIFLPMVAKP